MNNLKKIIIKLIYIFSCLFPRDKKTFVFIGWHKKTDGEVFADNAKYFFLYTSQEQKNIKSIWIAKSKELARKLTGLGYASFYEKSFLGFWYQLRAGFFVIDAYIQPNNHMLSGRSKIIQLLHGKGMKKKGYAYKPEKIQDFIFNTSPFTLSILPDVFKVGSKTFITGYSRNDIFYKKIKDSEIDTDKELISHIKNIHGNKKIVMYAPTFRRGQTGFDFNKVLPLEDLQSFAKENNIFFLLSLHNKYRAQQTESKIEENIGFVGESDIYPLLKEVDVFITDYSSSFADYLLLDKPIVFYPYDFDEYNEKEGLAADYDQITPGPKVNNFQDLKTAILSEDSYKEERKRVRDLYHTYQDGKSSERIFVNISKFNL
ncbi:MAG: CDP-glycerol glycerophosphotransferase family protein [Candidatus Pacebacteria bacterium]|nr:CDP-glycerol glycerophosphotransferase family protein [Candidatus Paceibacterota bacterium]